MCSRTERTASLSMYWTNVIRDAGCGKRDVLGDLDDVLRRIPHLVSRIPSRRELGKQPAGEEEELSRVRDRVQSRLRAAGDGRRESLAAVRARGCDLDLAAGWVVGIRVAIQTHRRETGPALTDPEDAQHGDATRLNCFGDEQPIERLGGTVRGGG